MHCEKMIQVVLNVGNRKILFSFKQIFYANKDQFHYDGNIINEIITVEDNMQIYGYCDVQTNNGEKYEGCYVYNF